MINTQETVILIEAGSVDDSTKEEVYRNLQVLYATKTGEQALDRDFGIDMDVLDYPQETTKALLAAEFVRKTERYEPRVRVTKVEWTGSNGKDGGIVPKVVVSFV